LGIVCPVRSGLVIAVDVRSALRVRDAAVWIGAGDGRTSGDVGNVLRSGVARGGGLFGLNLQWKLAVLVALGQDLDGEIRAVALTQTAADAVRGFDDRVVRQYEAVLGADLDADVAALAPLVDPPDVDEVDDRGSAVGSSFGGVGDSRGGISRARTAAAVGRRSLSLRNRA
jgi:hypothetical protein